MLWDRVPPEVEPSSPDNLLIFSAGLLHGTPVPGANRTSIDTFSLQTSRYSHSLLGGFFGPELKYAGYDKIVIRGKSPDPVYLWINNDKVEIRDARHLQGKGPLETADIIRKELEEPNAQVAAIGPAGENKVYMATIAHSNSSTSRGAGAVMGDKRLKAIAVRGTKDIYVARPAELFEICNSQFREIYDNPCCGDLFLHEDDQSWYVDNFAWGNARERKRGSWTKEREAEWKAVADGARVRWTGCYSCPKDCIQVISYSGRQKYFQECYSKFAYAMAAYKELDFEYDIRGLTQEYGLDGIATPQVIAFAIELYDAGILTEADLPEFPGDTGERFFYLVEKITRREGVGDILANGVYWAARQIGKGAESYDHNSIKKMEQLSLKLGMVNFPFFLMYATGEDMDITQIEGSYPQGPEPDIKKRKEFVEGWVAAPGRFKKMFLEWEPGGRQSIEDAVYIADWNEAMHYIDDAIGMCAFLSSFRGQSAAGPPITFTIYRISSHSRPEWMSTRTNCG